MYFLIGIWGGERRIYAAVKFFLYTMAGIAADAGRDPRASYRRTSGRADASTCAALPATPRRRPRCRCWLFAAFALAFAIKVPMFPFHTWLPDAHVEAPTARLGDPGRRAAQDGHLRLPALRAAALPGRGRALRAAGSALLAVIGIVYGALVSLVQTDLKKLVAYSSVVPPRLRDARHLRLHDRPAVDGRASTRCSTTASRPARSSCSSA